MNSKIHEQPKELVHYTTAVGLHGIVTNKTLWASHTSFLNDSEEVTGFFDRVLPNLLREPFDRYRNDVGPEVFQARLKLPSGEDPFEYFLHKIVQAYKAAELATQDHYVLSFCTNGNDYVSRNGLLSQWRGYGRDGGYAIVFGRRRLDEILVVEGKKYYEEALLLGDVEYRMDVLGAVSDFVILEKIRDLQERSYQFFRTNGDDEAVRAAEHLSTLSTLCKHQGFEEEREVRLVVSQPGAAIGPDVAKTSCQADRVIKSYIRGGVMVPCIHLFEDQKLKTLPITRVIVGPHPDKHERAKGVKLLLKYSGIDADVEVSKTPYRGA